MMYKCQNCGCTQAKDAGPECLSCGAMMMEPVPDPQKSFSEIIQMTVMQKPKTPYSSIVKAILIVVVICGLISGVICGAVFPITTASEVSGFFGNYTTTDSSFNAALMLNIWDSTATWSLLLLISYFVLKNQERMIDN